MKAKIDNNILGISVIKANYNETSSEVKIEEGIWNGVYTIVRKKDIIKDKKSKRFLVQVEDYNYVKGTWYWKPYCYCETISEVNKLLIRRSNMITRVLDREERVYI